RHHHRRGSDHADLRLAGRRRIDATDERQGRCAGRQSSLTAVRFAPGTRLGAYEILTPIGAGGMGEVYRARDTRLGREVAIKVVSDSLVTDPDALARFEREARAVAALNHPHIITIH